LKAEFQNVAGLNNGAAVRIGGIHQGTVKEIDLPSQPDGKVTVVMNVKSETRNIIKKDSRASIKTEGLLGDKYVEISFGSPKADPIGEDGTIASETQRDVSEQAQQIADEARAELSHSATTWKLCSTISSSVDFSKDADTVIPLN
jgi:phospholipid/cholesterol/gamma-HCH transport system substrate-binding protein